MKKCCQANFVRWESAALPVETLGGLDAGTKKFLNLANMTLNVITMHRLCNCWLINVSWNHRITANFTELQHIVSKNRFSCENMQLWVSLQRAHSSCSLCTVRSGHRTAHEPEIIGLIGLETLSKSELHWGGKVLCMCKNSDCWWFGQSSK